MDITAIIKNSIEYPISDLKNFLILGLIVFLAELYTIISSLGVMNLWFSLLFILTLVLGLARSGYSIRILGSSINGSEILPEFNNWKNLFLNGFRALIVNLVFVIPIVIIGVIMGIVIAFTSISSGANFAAKSYSIWTFMPVFLVIGIYLILIYPVILMALANMAKHENISAAFKFREIWEKITNVGLGKFIVWYIFTGLIYLILLGVGMGITALFGLEHIKFIGQILNTFIVIPFSIIFIYRSASLIYKSSLKDMDETELTPV